MTNTELKELKDFEELVDMEETNDEEETLIDIFVSLLNVAHKLSTATDESYVTKCIINHDIREIVDKISALGDVEMDEEERNDMFIVIEEFAIALAHVEVRCSTSTKEEFEKARLGLLL